MASDDHPSSGSTYPLDGTVNSGSNVIPCCRARHSAADGNEVGELLVRDADVTVLCVPRNTHAATVRCSSCSTARWRAARNAQLA